MADQIPQNDPLGDRLRATFAAEHADIERRQLSQQKPPATRRPVRWIPFAAAATLIAIVAIAGVAFFGNRTTDQAVELDVAAQPGTTPATESTGEPGQPTPGVAAQPTVDQPTADIPPGVPDVAPNECGEPVPLTPHFVWGVAANDADGGLIAHTHAGVDAPVTRVIAFNEMVVPTTGCVLTEDGAQWYELLSSDAVGNTFAEWVNARYLRPAEAACRIADEQPFRHMIENGDRLASIAEKYHISVDDIVRANPEMDPNLIVGGQLLRIPGPGIPVPLIDNPVDGYAIFADEMIVAFGAQRGTPYEWYEAGAVVAGSCSGTTEPDPLQSPVCLPGEINLFDLAQSQPTWTGIGPMTAWRGAAAPEPAGSAFAQVSLLTRDGQRLTGFIDPAETDLVDGHCIFEGDDSLVVQPCTRVAGADRSAGLGTDEVARSWTAGDVASTADHVHDIRTESNAECTRLVVTFGSGANIGEQAAAKLPPIFVDHSFTSVRITADGWQMDSSFGDTDRIDWEDGVGLITLGFNYELAAEFLYRDREPHVRFFENPARVVIDLFPSDSTTEQSWGPFGERFVLRQPIQTDLTGPGIPVDNDIVVNGFGRPFEAAGLYRIWSVPADVDPDAFLADPGEPLHEDFFATGGWAEGWGSFSVPLPRLEPGSYIAVFGELPPTDEIGFYGTGQLFRVTNDTSAPGEFPEAVLLPNVELAPEF